MKSRGKWLVFPVIAAMILLLAAGCGSKSSEPQQSAAPKPTQTASETPKQAAGEDENKNEEPMPKELTMYAGLLEHEALFLTQKFEKETGIKVNFVRMSGGEILARIKAEKENPQASVWYGGPADTFIAAKAEDLLEPYISPVSNKIYDKFKDPDGYWTGIYQGYLGFIVDDRFLKERNVEAPTSWEDLLKPEFKGQLMMANPGSSGTGYTALYTIVNMRGEEAALEYMAKLDKQMKQYTKAGEAPAQSVALGEAAVGITFIQNGMRYQAEGFDNIKISVPSEGTGYEVGAMAIIKGAPERRAAEIFIDWALSKEVQESFKEMGSFHFLTNSEAQLPVQAEPYRDTKLIDYDFKWAGENRSRLVEEWNKAIQK